MAELSKIAKHCIYPQTITTSRMPYVSKVAEQFGIRFDEWQNDIGSLILGKDVSGKYAAGVGGVGLSICRQTGKTFLIGGLITCLCIIDKNTTVLWTAHRTRTSGETFRSMISLANNSKIEPFVQNIRRGNGKEEISFTNGSRILFGAREQGFGRGFQNIDIEIFDEAQILTEKALDDMLPATSTAKNALTVYMGTPPRPSDPGEVFKLMRENALSGESSDSVWVEFGADRDAKPDDRNQWQKANPSYPHRTSEAAILRLKKQLGEDSFRRECLGIWDELAESEGLPLKLWRESVDEDPQVVGLPAACGLDMSPDRQSLAIGTAFLKPDGSAHVELAKFEDAHASGIAWAADWVADHWPRLTACTIDSYSPAMVLLPELEARHVKVTVSRTRKTADACGRLVDMLNAGKLTHRPANHAQALENAVNGCGRRTLGQSGLFTWTRKNADVNICPLIAVTLALDGVCTSKRRPGRKMRIMH